MLEIEDLKVGMKVKLRSDLVQGELYNGSSWIPEMQKDCIVVISEVDCMSFQLKCCIYTYTIEMIERIIK